jgi:hypothetical protein
MQEKIYHKELASGKWFGFSLPMQLSNIGSEIGRAINWKNKNNLELSQGAFERGLELLDLTILDQKNIKRLKELLLLREFLADYFCFGNTYKSTETQWNNYFMNFNYLVRK